MADFITIQGLSTTGTLPPLTRTPILVTRESVAGFTPDPQTGLITIQSTDLEAFNTDNPTSYGLRNALAKIFGQVYFYPYVYILSTDGVPFTSAMLDDANRNKRAWSLISYVERYNGGGTGGSASAEYFDDLEVISGWGVRSHRKLAIITYSMEDAGTLPYELLLGGSINSDTGFHTIVCNSKSTIDGNTVYDNISLAWASYNINGPFISRSWGSLSDAHDFLIVDADTYSNTTRSYIQGQGLAQYNGQNDLANSAFVWDTTMNNPNPAVPTAQIETLLAEDYIVDYVYVYIHNDLQQAGEPGVPNDDRGIRRIQGLTVSALTNCFGINLILANEDGSPAFTVGALTAAQVTVLSPTWTVTGKWPVGVITGRIRPFSAAHYIVISFAFNV